MEFHFGIGDKRVKRYIEAKKEEVPKLLRAFGIEFYRQVTISTPVDTGRARYSWYCSIDAPDFTITAAAPDGWKGQSSGGGAYYQYDTLRAMNFFTKDKVNENTIIYVCNALPYIARLNNGYSKQAPSRFVEIAFNHAVDQLFNYCKTIK